MRGVPWWWVLVLLGMGWLGIAVGAEPDPEAVRRLMEKYEREAAEEAAKKAPAVDHDHEAWKSAEKCGTAACYRAYLKTHPRGRYAEMARARLEPAAPSVQPEPRWISNELVNVRSGPGSEHPAITQLARGSEITWLGASTENPDWQRIRLSDGRVAYVHGNLLSRRRIAAAPTPAPRPAAQRQEREQLEAEQQRLQNTVSAATVPEQRQPASVPTRTMLTRPSDARMTATVVEFSVRGDLPDHAGAIMADLMVSAIANTGRFTLKDRLSLAVAARIAKAQELGATGLLDPKTAAELGRLYGVDAIVTGGISKLGDLITVQARLSDTQTAALLRSGQIQGRDLDTIQKKLQELATMIMAPLEP